MSRPEESGKEVEGSRVFEGVGMVWKVDVESMKKGLEIEEEEERRLVVEEEDPRSLKEEAVVEVEVGRRLVAEEELAKEELGEDSLPLKEEEEVVVLMSLLSDPQSSTCRSFYSLQHLPNSPSLAPRS